MAKTTGASYLLLPYAKAETDAQVLMARIALVDPRPGGGPTPQIIPDHAGQWAVIGGDAPVSQPVTAAAFKIFLDCTGVDLSEPRTLTYYGLSAPVITPAQDSAFTVLYLETNPAGLASLAAAINANIHARTPEDGTLAEVEVLPLSEAAKRLGPFPKPDRGWRGVIVDRYYSGRRPEAMDTIFPALVNQVAARSQEPPDWFQVALKRIPGSSPIPPVAARLVRLHAELPPEPGAANTYAATYDDTPGRGVVVRAIVEVPGGGPAPSVAWEGAGETVTGSPNDRMIRLNQISPIGRPFTVSATLSGITLNVSLIIRPRWAGSTVTNAEREGTGSATEQTWVAECSEDGPPVEITILTAPDTPPAHAHVQWTGGEPDPQGRGNVRRVSRRDLPEADGPVRVKAEINPYCNFLLYLLPVIRRVEVVAAPNVTNLGGGNFAVEFNPAMGATFTVQAVTFPNSVRARTSLGWIAPNAVGAVNGVNQVAIGYVVNAFGAGATAYACGVLRAGVLRRPQTINVTVEPRIANVAPAAAGYVHNLPAAGSYAIDYQALGTFVLQAVTVPATAAAASFLHWTDAAGAVTTGVTQINGRRDPLTAFGAAADVYRVGIRRGGGAVNQQAVNVTVVPTITGLAPVPAAYVHNLPAAGNFAVNYAAAGTFSIAAVTVPAGAGATAYLTWTDAAGAVTANVNPLTTARRDPLTAFGGAADVYTVGISCGGAVIAPRAINVTVVPTITGVAPVPAAFVHNIAAGQFAVEYLAGGTFSIAAVTQPVGAGATAYLSWTNAAGVVTANVNPLTTGRRDPLTAFGAAADVYAVGIACGGGVIAPQNIQVTVEPVVTGLTVSGYVFQDAPGNYHAYAIDGVFGFAAGQRLTVTAATSPAAVGAWPIQWAPGPPGPPVLIAGANANEKRIPLNGAQVWNVQASFAHTPPQQAVVNVRAHANYGGGDPHLAVNTITFAGGAAVRHDDPANVGVAYPRTWVVGTAHAQQAPQTYESSLAGGGAGTVQQAALIDITMAPAGPVAVTIRATAFVPRANNLTTVIQFANPAWSNVAIGVPLPVPPQLNLANIAGAPVLPAEVVHADPLYMFWEVQVGAGPWILFDVTSHMFYVTLNQGQVYRLAAGAGPSPQRPYHTLLAMSCLSANGANNANAVIARMFDAFSTTPPPAPPGAAPALNAATGVNNLVVRKLPPGALTVPLMTYWNPAIGSQFSVQATFASQLSAARCGAWAEMFIAMAAMQGVQRPGGGHRLHNTVVDPDPAVVGMGPPARGILVKHWVWNAPPAQAAGAYTHDRNPAVVGAGPAGDVTLGNNGVVAQNNQRPQSYFTNHAVVLDSVTNIIYDPSYGTLYDPALLPVGINPRRAWINAALEGLCVFQPAVPNAGYSVAPPPPPGPDNRVTLTDLMTGAVLP